MNESQIVARELPVTQNSGRLVTVQEAIEKTSFDKTELVSLLVEGRLAGEDLGDGEWLVDLEAAKAEKPAAVGYLL